jgi:NTE family protein
MGRWTWPRYSLLDHAVFDETLAEHFTDIDIADLKRPFFAVATNLTRNELSILRRGPLWLAVRASAAIPALFPPIYAANGDMLVDGGLLDNVPLRPMRSLKEGPNVIFDLDVPALGAVAEGATLSLPSRAGLLRHVLTGTAERGLPAAPGPQAVLVRALMRDNRDVAGLIEPGDIALRFPIPAGASVLDWSRHRELRDEARAFAAARLAEVASSSANMIAAEPLSADGVMATRV